MADAEQWNVRICLAGGAPTVKTLSTDKEEAIAAGFNLRLDTRRGALQCYDTDPGAPWLSILHPESRADAHFDLDLRNLPAGFAAARASSSSSKKKSKKRKAESDPDGTPTAKKPKKTAAPAAPVVGPAADSAGEMEAPPKKKRAPSTKGRKKAPSVESGSNGGGTVASQYQDELAALLDGIGPLDT